jgi:glycosyltransferase involved in cell wall biosynthesis
MVPVSVIIPNYNHAKYLSKRIDSVLNQTFEDFEIILLDDGSTDNSKEVIERYRSEKRISHIIYNEENTGSTFKQWKKGLELAKGQLIWIAESDDYAAPSFLATLIKPFEQYPDLLISYCLSLQVDDNNHVLGEYLSMSDLDDKKWRHDYVMSSEQEFNSYLKYKNTLPNASAVLFKNGEHLNELISEDMRYSGDWFFWQKLLQRPGKIAYTYAPLNYFRTHSHTTRSMVNASVDTERQRFKEYKSHVPFLINPFERRYNWMIHEWVQRRSALKGTLSYYTTLLHPVLAIRCYLGLLKKLFIKDA